MENDRFIVAGAISISALTIALMFLTLFVG